MSGAQLRLPCTRRVAARPMLLKVRLIDLSGDELFPKAGLCMGWRCALRLAKYWRKHDVRVVVERSGGRPYRADIDGTREVRLKALREIAGL